MRFAGYWHKVVSHSVHVPGEDDGPAACRSYADDVEDRHRKFLKRKPDDKATFRPKKKQRAATAKVLRMLDNQVLLTGLRLVDVCIQFLQSGNIPFVYRHKLVYGAYSS